MQEEGSPHTVPRQLPEGDDVQCAYGKKRGNWGRFRLQLDDVEGTTGATGEPAPNVVFVCDETCNFNLPVKKKSASNVSMYLFDSLPGCVDTGATITLQSSDGYAPFEVALYKRVRFGNSQCRLVEKAVVVPLTHDGEAFAEVVSFVVEELPCILNCFNLEPIGELLRFEISIRIKLKFAVCFFALSSFTLF